MRPSTLWGAVGRRSPVYERFQAAWEAAGPNPTFDIPQLAREHGVKPRTILRWLRKAGVCPPSPEDFLAAARAGTLGRGWHMRYMVSPEERKKRARKGRLTYLRRRAATYLADPVVLNPVSQNGDAPSCAWEPQVKLVFPCPALPL